MSSWPIYRGTGVPHNGIADLPDPPNWRKFFGEPVIDPKFPHADPSLQRRLGVVNGRVPSQQEIEYINTALYLRRPLLVTGHPGVGKSTLAYAVAHELGLGPVLRWPITTRSTLREGLYHYDPIGRLREENLRRIRGGDMPSEEHDIGRHIRLGPLGTALLPYRQAESVAHRRDRQERYRSSERSAECIRRGRIRDRGTQPATRRNRHR